MNFVDGANRIDDPMVKVEEEMKIAFKRFECLENENALITVSKF